MFARIPNPELLSSQKQIAKEGGKGLKEADSSGFGIR
jgi:hypothetical protein